jgi:hypothetical protein
LDPKTDNDFSSRVENPTSRNYVSRANESSGRETKRSKTPEEISSEILAKIKTLHYEGRRLDEIYEILESDGYDYEAIEPVLVDFLDKNRAPIRNPQTSAQNNSFMKPKPTPQTAQPRSFVNPQFNATDRLPQQRPAATTPPNSAPIQGVRPGIQGQRSNTPDKGLEVVELNYPQGAQRNNEEVPTNIQKTSNAMPVQAQIEAASPEALTQNSDSTKGDFAPLFVRVGKYRETLETLNDLENYLRAMARLFELVEELEKVRQINIAALDKMHKKALATADKLSSGLLKPKGMSIEGTRESDVELNKLGDVIGDLSKELSMLKKEVDKLNQLE